MQHKLLLLIVSFIAISSIQAQTFDDLEFGTSNSFEVVTWNIENYENSSATRNQYIQEAIEAMNADVVCLQEIYDTAGFRSVVDGMDDYEVLIHDGYHSGLAYVYNNTTVEVQSFYKIYDEYEYWNTFPRAPVVFELSMNGVDYVVINNHYKCCGDGTLDMGNHDDEEMRRYNANELLKDYIDTHFSSANVLLVGDLNDVLTDSQSNNVFQHFIDDEINYQFADMDVATGPSSGWSYPSWPSHLDHILITDELFDTFDHDLSVCEAIHLDSYFDGGWNEYERSLSDHRPVGILLEQSPTFVFDPNLTELKVFPNPCMGTFKVNLDSKYQSVKVQLLTQDGRLIDTMYFTDRQFLVIECNAPSGVYVVMVEYDHQRKFTTLVKR